MLWLDQKQINALAKTISNGQFKLPDLSDCTNADCGAIWAPRDSGSSGHVIDAKTYIPGAVVEAPVKGST